MTVADPHAIPESDQACGDYLREADEAWDHDNPDHAFDLYRSLVASGFVSDAARSHASHRLTLIAVNRGEVDLALFYAADSHEPGIDDLRRSLDNQTPNDRVPDPDVIPLTKEEVDDWWPHAAAARAAGDWDLSRRWFGSIATATCSPPDVTARAQVMVAEALHHTGDDATARLWLEPALPALRGGDELTYAHELFDQIGVHSTPDHSSPAAQRVGDGIERYQLGELAAAREDLQAALHLEGTDEVKGRARYYLGAMDYQDKRYADARLHLEAAAASAPVEERTWAAEMLSWRWDERPA